MKLLCGTLPQRLVPVLTPEGHIMKPDGVSIWNHILWCHCYQWAVLCCSAAVKGRVKLSNLFLQISANVRLGKLMFVFHNYQDTIREVPSLEIFSRRHSQRSVLRLLQSKKVRYFKFTTFCAPTAFFTPNDPFGSLNIPAWLHISSLPFFHFDPIWLKGVCTAVYKST